MLWTLGSLVLTIVAWDLFVRIFGIKEYLVPSPLKVGQMLVEQ